MSLSWTNQCNTSWWVTFYIGIYCRELRNCTANGFYIKKITNIAAVYLIIYSIYRLFCWDGVLNTVLVTVGFVFKRKALKIPHVKLQNKLVTWMKVGEILELDKLRPWFDFHALKVVLVENLPIFGVYFHRWVLSNNIRCVFF